MTKYKHRNPKNETHPVVPVRRNGHRICFQCGYPIVRRSVTHNLSQHAEAMARQAVEGDKQMDVQVLDIHNDDGLISMGLLVQAGDSISAKFMAIEFAEGRGYTNVYACRPRYVGQLVNFEVTVLAVEGE